MITVLLQLDLWLTKISILGKYGGGVPAHFLMTTKEYADKCKRNTPEYDKENYRQNFRDEVNKICNKAEKRKLEKRENS